MAFWEFSIEWVNHGEGNADDGENERILDGMSYAGYMSVASVLLLPTASAQTAS